MEIRPSREEFHALAARYTVVPVWTDLLADLETPVAAFMKLVGDGQGFLLESVEHGERWSRFSFVGRNPVATLTLRDGVVTVDGHPDVQVPTDRGMLAALEVLLDTYRGPELDELPPLTGGMMGYLGYDVIREVEHLPDVPPDDLGVPEAVMSMIGSLAAFDHWRQRVTLIESVPTHGAGSRRRSTPPTTLPSSGWPPRSPTSAARCRTRRWSRRSRDDPLPDVRSTMAGGYYQRAVKSAKELHRRRRHLPGGAGPALRHRPAGRAVRRLPGAAPGQPEPVHVLRAHAGADDRRLVARADGAAARRAR